MEDLSAAARRDETGQRYVIGPLGIPLRLADLPPAENVRWVARRKAELVAAVEGGLLDLPTALATYRIALEEFEGWRASLKGHGVAGLRSTRMQVYGGRRDARQADASHPVMLPSD